MSTPAIGPHVWRADTIDAAAHWYYRIPARAACVADVRPVLDALERGRGFAILTGPSPDASSEEEARALYWRAGQLLGEPFAQNVQGVLLYDVRDTGQDVARGARFSVTSYESSFHTDGSFGDTVPDYVGLLCLRTARSGGVSQVVNGHAVYDCLRQESPDVLEVLSRPFHVDRRGGVREGEAPTVQFPVIRREGEELLYRYLRYWIQAGHDKAGVPLTAEQVRALDVLDGVLGRPELRAEFSLKPGDMFFINNRSLLHNRTGFEDHPEPERRRHLVRLWLRARLA